MARELGYADPDAMLAMIPARTLEEWKKYFGVVAWEQEQASKKMKSKAGSRRR